MSGGERKLLNDTDLFRAFSERMGDSKLFLFVDVEDKPVEMFSNSAVTMGENGTYIFRPYSIPNSFRGV